MSSIDPGKLKVVDLRSELTARGLDSKGNKAALVKRLKDALEKELKQDLPDTSIADTSTEELDTSQGDEQVQEPPKKENIKPPPEEAMETDELRPNKTTEKSPSSTESKSVDKTDVKSLEKPKAVKTEDNSGLSTPSETKQEPIENAKTVNSKSESSDESKNDVKEQKSEENGEHSEQIQEKVHKSRWSEDKPSEENNSQQTGDKDQQSDPGTSKPEGESDQKGEKRKRTSPSPDRSQRRRSRSPIKEDEPTIDNDKVQLSWYDSDLHLQLDKESFLSAKPLTEGAFGYAWAGVRGTHGVSSGKACYEVKLVEEIKWEDFSKYEQRGGRDRYRTDHRKNQKRDKDKRDSEKKSGEKSKTETEENKDKKSTEKEATSENNKEKSTEKEKDEKQETEEVQEKADDNIIEPEEPGKSEETPMETDEKPEENDQKSIETESSSDVKKDDTTESTPKDDKTEIEENKKETEEHKKETEENKAETDENKKETEENKKETEENKKEVISEPIPSHLFRVGWSLVTSNLQLGEQKYSYGYESSGKFVTEKQFVDYGIKFGAGDVIGAYVDINTENVTIRYTVNGQVQPVASTIPRTDFPEDNFALYPHVLSRNYAFELNFGDREEPWHPIPSELEGFLYISKIEDKVSGPTRPENRGDCEVILMCGLPASGKTHWVREHVGFNLEKRYTVLGNTNILERMTVSGEPLKLKFKGRWSLLMDRLQKSLNKLISIAAHRRRNYIIDQTNVFPSAQRRKMRPFEGFKRRAVIVVVGEEEQARRQTLQEAQDGKDVPDSTILEMQAAMSLPEKGEWLEEVTFVGVEEAEAKEIVKKYNAAGKEAGYGSEKRFARRDDRWQNRRNDYRGKNYRERNYQTQRYDPRGPRQGSWSNQRSGGSNWNRDRRDNRGPPNRDWRGSGRDHGNRGSRSQTVSYNRNRSQSGSRGSWSGWSNQQGWNQQSFGSGSGGYGGGSQGWSNWKYNQGSSGQGYGNYQNWNYYGQYNQNWNSQGQQTNSTAVAGSGNNLANSHYGQGYNTQEAWAQYARQYAQQSAAAQNQAAPFTKK